MLTRDKNWHCLLQLSREASVKIVCGLPFSSHQPYKPQRDIWTDGHNAMCNARSQPRSARRRLVIVPRYNNYRSTHERRAPLLLARRLRTLSQTVYVIHHCPLTFSAASRNIFFQITLCVFSALEIFLPMRFINYGLVAGNGVYSIMNRCRMNWTTVCLYQAADHADFAFNG